MLKMPQLFLRLTAGREHSLLKWLLRHVLKNENGDKTIRHTALLQGFT